MKPKHLRGTWYIFPKFDGSNLRFEWSKRKGFTKFGSRRRLFDETDLQFGSVVPLFLEFYAGDLEAVAIQNGWEKATFFCEYLGDKSFAGFHEEGDPKRLYLIDVCLHKASSICKQKIGFLSPKTFVDLFSTLSFKAPLLDVITDVAAISEAVRQNQYAGQSFEGVICKREGKGASLHVKIKSEAWVEEVLRRKLNPD